MFFDIPLIEVQSSVILAVGFNTEAKNLTNIIQNYL